MRAKGQLSRLTLGTDTPGGTGVIPRGMLRNICYIASVCGVPPAEAVAIATGNTARRTASTSVSWRPVVRRT